MRKFKVCIKEYDTVTIEAEVINLDNSWVLFTNEVKERIPHFIVAAFPTDQIEEIREIKE